MLRGEWGQPGHDEELYKNDMGRRSPEKYSRRLGHKIFAIQGLIDTLERDLLKRKRICQKSILQTSRLKRFSSCE